MMPSKDQLNVHSNDFIATHIDEQLDAEFAQVIKSTHIEGQAQRIATMNRAVLQSQGIKRARQRRESRQFSAFVAIAMLFPLCMAILVAFGQAVIVYGLMGASSLLSIFSLIVAIGLSLLKPLSRRHIKGGSR